MEFIGQKFKVEFDPESYDGPVINGSIVTLIKFDEIAYGRVYNFGQGPGYWDNTCYATVLTKDGKEHPFATHNLRDLNGKYCFTYDNTNGTKKFVRPLPETLFYEWDIVDVNDVQWNWQEKRVKINRIDYNYIGTFCNDGITPYPWYSVELNSGGTTAVRERSLSLVERGLVWKYYHKEPLEFNSIEEEANLFRALGQSDEVRNPACDLYKWEVSEALEALKSGLGHAIIGMDGLFGGKSRIAVERFHDEELGKRIAKYSLENWK